MMRVVKVVHDAVFGVVQDRRGTVVTFLAASIIPLVAFTGLAVDTARGYLMKSRLSYALDAAALAGGRALSNPNANVNAMITQFFNANFPANYMGATVDGPYVAMGANNDTITLDATATMGTSLMRVLGLNDMEVAGNTQVTLSSVNLEVSLVLDITGSMDGQPLADLKSAATDLVNIVVKNSQTPFYSRIALVPYSMGVNLGSYAAAARGPVAGPLVNITGASKTNPVTITAPGHAFSTGQTVFIRSVSGMTQLNNREFTVGATTTNTFTLAGVDGRSYSTYWSNGTVGRMCTGPGCEYIKFDADTGSDRMYQVSTCVTERTGTDAYTDVAPSTSYVGWAYPNDPGEYPSTSSSQRNRCVASEIIPLTSNKTTLTNAINNFTAAGSTAGQIGVGWGWYMISPNFAYLWPDTENQPGPYGDQTIQKVAIIMTDGAFNTAFADGVIAQDSGSGSGGSDYQINKNATNVSAHPGRGSSYSQALQMCAAMKTAGILIYTVGFNISGSSEAQEVIQGCATDPSYVYLPEGGTELSAAFNAIAVNVSQLRLSK
jgi:Flp pilus assembly protein TadG